MRVAIADDHRLLLDRISRVCKAERFEIFGAALEGSHASGAVTAGLPVHGLLDPLFGDE